MAELSAIYFAILYVHCQPWQHHLLYINSLSTLQSFHSYTLDHPVIMEILHQVSVIHKAGKSVVFCLVPAYTGLPGSEAADAATKEAALCADLTSDRA
jgi:hypothetical protein